MKENASNAETGALRLGSRPDHREAFYSDSALSQQGRGKMPHGKEFCRVLAVKTLDLAYLHQKEFSLHNLPWFLFHLQAGIGVHHLKEIHSGARTNKKVDFTVHLKLASSKASGNATSALSVAITKASEPIERINCVDVLICRPLLPRGFTTGVYRIGQTSAFYGRG